MTDTPPANPSESQRNRHELTHEERRRGAYAAAESRRQRRDEARRLAIEQLAETVERATAAIAEALDANLLIVTKDGDTYQTPAYMVRLRAAVQVLDRVVGKPVQAVELTSHPEAPVTVEHRGVSLDDVLR